MDSIYNNLEVVPLEQNPHLVVIKAGDIAKDKGAISLIVPKEFAAYIVNLQDIATLHALCDKSTSSFFRNLSK